MPLSAKLFFWLAVKDKNILYFYILLLFSSFNHNKMYLKDLKNAVIFKFIHRKISSCLSTHLEGILDQERK
jgi:hypothetical protein